MVEDIARKYHYFGMLLSKDEEMELWIEKIKNNLKSEQHYAITSSLSKIIYDLISNKNYADEVIIDIQQHIGFTEGFMTHKQLTEKLSNLSNRRRKPKLD